MVSGDLVQAGMSQASVLLIVVICRMKRERGQSLLPPGDKAEGVVFPHTNLCSPGLLPR